MRYGRLLMADEATDLRRQKKAKWYDRNSVCKNPEEEFFISFLGSYSIVKFSRDRNHFGRTTKKLVATKCFWSRQILRNSSVERSLKRLIILSPDLVADQNLVVTKRVNKTTKTSSATKFSSQIQWERPK